LWGRAPWLRCCEVFRLGEVDKELDKELDKVVDKVR